MQPRSELAFFRQRQEEKRSTCDGVINVFSFVYGAMASSAVSLVLYLRDAAGNHAETRTGAHIYYGDAASFHEWEFRTRLRAMLVKLVIDTLKMSKVCDAVRGDIFVAAQEVGFDNLVEIIDGRPCGIDTLINHVWEMVFPCPKNCSDMSRQNGESMKQYVSRRRRCWTLLTPMDPVIHLSEGHRSDMLLDLSGLTREERVMVQASISNERDFDRVADALIIQHPRIPTKKSIWENQHLSWITYTWVALKDNVK